MLTCAFFETIWLIDEAIKPGHLVSDFLNMIDNIYTKMADPTSGQTARKG